MKKKIKFFFGVLAVMAIFGFRVESAEMGDATTTDAVIDNTKARCESVSGTVVDEKFCGAEENQNQGACVAQPICQWVEATSYSCVLLNSSAFSQEEQYKLTGAKKVCAGLKTEKDCNAQESLCEWSLVARSGLSVSTNALLDQAASLNQLRTEISTPRALIGAAIQFFMGLMGTVAFIFFIYAGILWMIAQGNSEQIEKSKQIMIWTGMGVLGMLATYILVTAVFNILTKGTI